MTTARPRQAVCGRRLARAGRPGGPKAMRPAARPPRTRVNKLHARVGALGESCVATPRPRKQAPLVTVFWNKTAGFLVDIIFYLRYIQTQ